MSVSLKWFEDGAAALARIGRTEGNLYVCPICLRIFGRDRVDQLSEEHVPPESLGGKAIALTCRRCNSEGGSELDIHAARQQKAEIIVARKDRGPSRARVTIGDTQVIADVRTDAGILVSHRPDLNHPRAGDNLVKALVDVARNRQLPPINLSFKLGGKLDLHRAGVSWLRAAYLAAFAAFGYAYILRPLFDIVRRQIQSPQEIYIQRHTIFLPLTGPEDRYLLFVREPSWLKALAVRFGTRAVLLPIFDDAPLPYEELPKRVEAGADLSINGNSGFPWPTKPEHRFDVANPDEHAAIEHFLIRSCYGPVGETTSNPGHQADG